MVVKEKIVSFFNTSLLCCTTNGFSKYWCYCILSCCGCKAKLQTRFFVSILLVNFWLEIVSRRVGFPIFRLAFFSDLNSCKQDRFFNFGLEHYFWLKSLQAGLVFQFWVSAFWLEFASKVFNIVCPFHLEFGK